jgi:hypothetical protein
MSDSYSNFREARAVILWAAVAALVLFTALAWVLDF